MAVAGFLVAADVSAASPTRSQVKGPLPGAAARTKVKVPAHRKRMRVAHPKLDAAASRHLAALLRAAADESTPEGFPKRSAGTLARSQRAAAKRIVERLDRASPADRRAVVGAAGEPATSRRADIQRLVDEATARPAPSLQHFLPAIELPAEGVPLPTTVALHGAGLMIDATEDADGTDELTVFAIVARPQGQGYALKTVPLASDLSAGVGASALGATIFDGATEDVMVLTAVLEDDGGNAAAALEEIETLVALSANVAETMDGSDRLGVLRSLVDYGLFVAGTPDATAAARSTATTIVRADEWAGLLSADRNDGEAIPWKLAIPHEMGSGRYELLIDLPGAVPQMKSVRISAQQLSVTHPPDVELISARVQLGIGDASATIDVEGDAFGQVPPVQRKVVAATLPVTFGMRVFIGPPIPQSLYDCAENGATKRKRRNCKRKIKRLLADRKNRWADAGGSGNRVSRSWSAEMGGFVRADAPRGERRKRGKPRTNASFAGTEALRVAGTLVGSQVEAD